MKNLKEKVFPFKIKKMNFFSFTEFGTKDYVEIWFDS